MSRYVLTCGTVRQHALLIKYYHVAGACRGAPRLVAVSRGGRRILPDRGEVVAKNSLWRPPQIGAIALPWLGNSYVSGLVYGGVYGKRSRKRIAVRSDAVGAAEVTRLKVDPHPACSRVAISFSELSGMTRRCALRPLDAASCVLIARRRRLGRNAVRETGERTSR